MSRGVNKGNVKHGKHLTLELGNVDCLFPIQRLQHIVFLSFPTSVGVTGGLYLRTGPGEVQSGTIWIISPLVTEH